MVGTFSNIRESRDDEGELDIYFIQEHELAKASKQIYDTANEPNGLVYMSWEVWSRLKALAGIEYNIGGSVCNPLVFDSTKRAYGERIASLGRDLWKRRDEIREVRLRLRAELTGERKSKSESYARCFEDGSWQDCSELGWEGSGPCWGQVGVVDMGHDTPYYACQGHQAYKRYVPEGVEGE